LVEKHELAAPRDLTEGFFRLLDRQTEEKLPANMLLAFLALYEMIHILDMAHGSVPAAQRFQQISPLKDGLLKMLSSTTGADLPLMEMASMLGGKNPLALLDLLKMSAGPSPEITPSATDPNRSSISPEVKKPGEDVRKISTPSSR
jgi:hypothetical protein